MNKKFSTKWNSSTQPRKQRKFRHNAPMHIKGKFLTVHLSPELRKKYGTRSIRIRKGDTVKIMSGLHKTKTGKVQIVSVKRLKVYVEGIDVARKEGNRKLVALEPSNIMITDLYLDDKKRIAKLESNKPKEKSD